jgi:uncharacterized membrane protein
MPGKSISVRSFVMVMLVAVGSAANAQVGEFIELGGVSETVTGVRAVAVSGDGRVAVGQAFITSGVERAVAWDIVPGALARGVATIAGGPPDVLDTYVTGVSRDGAYIACTQYLAPSCSYAGTASGVASGAASFLTGVDCLVTAQDISDEGVLVGDYFQPGVPARGYSWRGGASSLIILAPAVGFTESSAVGISAAGWLVAGASSGRGGTQATYWQAGVPTLVPYLPNTARDKYSRCFAISRDASHIVGESSSLAAANNEAPFLYDVNTGAIVQIGTNSQGLRIIPTGVSSRGDIVVGYYFSLTSASRVGGWVWRRGFGLTDITSYLNDELSLTLPGWTFLAVMDVNADGSVVVGEAINPAGVRVGFAARTLESPVPCTADFNDDGGVDGADVEAFFIMFADGEPRADVNVDGGVDGSDVEAFFIPWLAGC